MRVSTPRGWGWAWIAAVPTAVALLIPAADRQTSAVAEPPAAYDLGPLPSDLDSLTTLEDAARQIEGCVLECLGIVYMWSPRMPLSRSGIANVARAAENLGTSLTLVGSEALHDYADAGVQGHSGRMPLADALLGTGALAHAPALVVHDGGEVLGHAILGYKTAEAYESLIAGRLSGEGLEGSGGGVLALERASPRWPDARTLVDYDAVGIPGAYFRSVPGRQAIAYESGGLIYLLDLVTGESRVAPGYIDFIPTPDGRYFVTPGLGDGGLTFFVAEEVFEATRSGLSGSVESIFTDLRMRDQYPSVGILEQDESRTLYRVLTSWFDGLLYRDYDVRVDAATGRSSVRPASEPVEPCAGRSLSTPIMSQDGLEVAARDEATGTTKIFAILDEGRCREVVDLGVPTSKVAWDRTGGRLAFATPRVRSRSGGSTGGGAGIFVFDLDERLLTRIEDSEGASHLAFPDFVGDESVVFLIPGRTRREGSIFRVIDGIH